MSIDSSLNNSDYVQFIYNEWKKGHISAQKYEEFMAETFGGLENIKGTKYDMTIIDEASDFITDATTAAKEDGATLTLDMLDKMLDKLWNEGVVSPIQKTPLGYLQMGGVRVPVGADVLARFGLGSGQRIKYTTPKVYQTGPETYEIEDLSKFILLTDKFIRDYEHWIEFDKYYQVCFIPTGSNGIWQCELVTKLITGPSSLWMGHRLPDTFPLMHQGKQGPGQWPLC